MTLSLCFFLILSLHISVPLSQFVRPSVLLMTLVCVSLCLSVCVFVSIYLSISVSPCLSVHSTLEIVDITEQARYKSFFTSRLKVNFYSRKYISNIKDQRRQKTQRRHAYGIQADVRNFESLAQRISKRTDHG